MPLNTLQVADKLDADPERFSYANYRQHIRTLRRSIDQAMGVTSISSSCAAMAKASLPSGMKAPTAGSRLQERTHEERNHRGALTTRSATSPFPGQAPWAPSAISYLLLTLKPSLAAFYALPDLWFQPDLGFPVAGAFMVPRPVRPAPLLS